jgi:hypothetical protein
LAESRALNKERGIKEIGRRAAEDDPKMDRCRSSMEVTKESIATTTPQEAAFTRSLNRVNATRRDGQKLDMWWYATVCNQKTGGRWTVTHEPNSVPSDVGSSKVSLDELSRCPIVSTIVPAPQAAGQLNLKGSGRSACIGTASPVYGFLKISTSVSAAWAGIRGGSTHIEEDGF